MTDIKRKRGDTYADEFTVKSATTGLPVDITGYSFLLTVDPSPDPIDDTTKIYQLTGTILSPPTAGRVEFAPNATQANQVGNFFYDVQMFDGAGRKRTIDGGQYIYTQDITKT